MEKDLTSLDGGVDPNAEKPVIVSEKAWGVGEITLLKKSKLVAGQTALKIKVEDQWKKSDADGSPDEPTGEPTEPAPFDPTIPMNAAASTSPPPSGDSKNRAILSLPLANTDNDKLKVQWRHAILKDGALGEWSDGSPLDGNNTDDTIVYRAWIDFKPDATKKFEGVIGGWDTTLGIVDLDPTTGAPTGGEDANTLFSANGVHQVAIEKVEGGKDKMLLIANPTEADPDGKKEVEVKGESVDVENLTITDVSTNAGNPDYLLFDPAEEAKDENAHPLIKFKIEDKGEKHRYVWTIKVNDTNLASWKKKATVRGVAEAPGEIVVHLNDDAWLAAHGQTQDAHLEDWGTYSFDIFVAEVKEEPAGEVSVTDAVEGDPFSLPRLDYYAFKQGGKDSKYFLTIPKDAERKRHYVQPKWEEKNGKIRDFFEAGYYLQDKLSKPASKVWFDLYSPRLTAKVTDKQLNNTALDTDSKQEVFAAKVPIEDDIDWQAADDTHTFIGIFMALDDHAERHRDHKPAHTLAVNDRPKDEATFQFQKINQDEPRNISWGPIGEAIYTGSIASTADNIKIKVYPKSRKNISHANWFVTWGPTAKTSDRYSFAKEVFRVPQGKKADRGNKSVTVALDLFPNDKKPRGGFYRIGCVVRFQKEGNAEGKVGEFISRPIRVGVRTDDAIVFGWINANGVQLPSPAQAKGDITGILPRTGLAAIGPDNVAQTAFDLSTSTAPIIPIPPYVNPGAARRVIALYKIGRAGLVLGQLLQCKDNPDNPTGKTLESLYIDINKLMPTGPDFNRLKFGEVFSKDTPTGDRKYALYWQFKYAANNPATSSVPRTSTRVKAYDFKDTNRIAIDYNRLRQFSNLRQTNWVKEDRVLGLVTGKLPNVFVSTIGAVELGKGGTVYKMLNHFQVRYLLDSKTGTQIDSMQPLRHRMSGTWIGITGDPLTEIAGISGQKGPLERKVSFAKGAYGYQNTGVIRQVNDGSPDDNAVKEFATLTRRLNAFWEDIGSQIYFEKDRFEPTMIAQTYPTYELFVNGDHAEQHRQAQHPIGHFYYKSFPFGTGRTSGIFNRRGFQGGRDGKSIPSAPEPPIHPSARKAPIEEGMPR